MEKLHQETKAFNPPHLRQSTAFTIPSRSNSGSGTFTAMLNDIEEDEDILLLEVDGQPITTLISIILTCVVQPLSRQHIK